MRCSSLALSSLLALVVALSTARSLDAETTFRLVHVGPEPVRAGAPTRFELRADLERPLCAVAFDVHASSDVPATLTRRSADPRAENGLAYLSRTSQTIPFIDDLPHDLSQSPAEEVLVHVDDPPFDSVPRGDDVLVAWFEVTPATGGELTIEIANLRAATTEWNPDGVPIEPLGLDGSRSSVTLVVGSSYSADADGDGDVDMHDFAALQLCFSGAGIAPLDPECAGGFDADEDGDVDGNDLETFASTFTGPGERVDEGQPAGAPEVRADGRAAGGAEAFPGASADVDHSEQVDGDDLLLVRQRLGSDASDPENESADVNKDGAIDLLDLIFVRNRIGHSRFGRSFGPDLRITELDFSDASGAPWVELTHVGTGLLDIRPFYIANEKGGFNYIFSNLPDSIRMVSPGFRLVISFDGPSPPTWIGGEANPTGAVFHVGAPFRLPDPTEDACRLLVQDGRGGGWVAQRVAWGGTTQVDAVLDPAATPLPIGGSLGIDAYEPDLWRVFATATPGRPNELEPPMPYFPYEGLEVDGTPPLRLVWTDIRYGLLRYRVQVAGGAGFSTPIADTLVEGTVLDLDTDLAPGIYSWRVRVEAGAWESAWSREATFEVYPAVGDGGAAGNLIGTERIDWFLQNPLPVPEKDTRLLCFDCERSSGSHAWDAAHSVPDHTCPHGKHYGALTVIAAVNHLYGGSVKLDQIATHLTQCNGGTPPCVDPFGHEHAYLGDADLAMGLVLWSLGLGDTFPSDVSLDPKSARFIATHLHDQRPVIAWLKGGFGAGGCGTNPLLVFAYLPESPTRPERVQVLDPGLGRRAGVNITAEIPLSRICSAKTIPAGVDEAAIHPVNENPDMKQDSDGDGITDFDEDERLVTDRGQQDTDGDGLGDKLEIFSYRFGRGRVRRKPDVDGDGLRAEVDLDGDNDGCPDGEEDKNRNGHFLMSVGAQILDYDQYSQSRADSSNRERGESDPFFADLYQLVMTPGRQKVALRKSVPIEIELTYVDTAEKKQGKEDAKIELSVDDEQFRGDLDDSEVTTDENGRARTLFRPGGDIYGDVEIKAVYKPCENAVRQWEAVVRLEIVEVDWMFTIQNEAVLTRPEVLKLNQTRTFPGRVSRRDWRTKDVGYQRLEGFFTYPDLERPGRYIDHISVSPSHSTIVLRVNDEVAENRTWTRTSEDEEPMTWRIDVADPDILPVGASGFRLPRYLIVSGEGFQVRTPLITWSACGSQSDQVRDYTTGHLVLSRDYTSRAATAHFGDGDAGGYDTGPGREDWPKSEHTSVSFIPRGPVDGYSPGHAEFSGWWPVDWTGASGDSAYSINVFGTDKNDATIIDPFTWSVTLRSSADLDALVATLVQEIDSGPRITPPALIGELVFERDYLQPELDELEQRGLEPPKYSITLRDR